MIYLNKLKYMEISSKRLKSIDTVKGIMIWGIVIYHMSENLKMAFPFLSPIYTYGGDLGNTIFFMLSGFMMEYTYSAKVIKGNVTLYTFIYKRISKWYLIYFFSSILSIIFIVDDFGLQVLNVKQVVLNLTLTTSGWIEDIYPYNLPCWFLSCLIIQYILWYLSTKLFKLHAWYIFLFLVLGGAIIEKMILNLPFLYYHTGEGMVPFFIGCLLYKIQNKVSKGNLYKIEWILGSMTFCFLFLTFKIGFQAASGNIKYTWYFLIAPLIILYTFNIALIKRIMENNIIYTLFGKLSTTIFFWHYPFMRLFNYIFLQYQIEFNANVQFIMYIIMLYIFCLFYYILEIKIKNCFIK